MNTVRNHIKSGLYYIAANFAVSVIQFMLVPILSRYMVPAEFGRFAMFQSWLSLLAVFSGFGVESVIVNRYYNKNGSRSDDVSLFVYSGVQLVLICGAILLGFCAFLLPPIATLYQIPELWVLLGVITSVLTALIQIQLCILNLSKLSCQYSLIQVGQILLLVIFVVIFVVYNDLSAEGRVFAQLLSTFFIVCIIALKTVKKFKLAVKQWSLGRCIEIVKTWVRIMPHSAGMYLISMFDRLVIVQHFGVAELGVYSVAVQTSMAIGLIFDAINKMYVPYLFEALRVNDYRQKVVIVRWMYVWFVVAISIGVIFSWLIPIIIKIIFKSEYQPNIIVVICLSIGQSFWGMYLAVTNVVIYSNKLGYLSLSTVLIGVVHMALLFVMVEKYGVVGASFGYCISMFIRFIVTWYLSIVFYPLPWLPAIYTRLSFSK